VGPEKQEKPPCIHDYASRNWVLNLVGTSFQNLVNRSPAGNTTTYVLSSRLQSRLVRTPMRWETGDGGFYSRVIHKSTPFMCRNC